MKELSGLVLSDIHLGHTKNRARDIIRNMELIIYDKKFKEIDYILFAGDLYERILNMSSIDTIESITFMTKLAKYASNNNIKIRIVEGTPSHDFNQCATLENVIKNLDIDVDFRYVRDIELEESDLNILYIPDEIRDSVDEIMADVSQIVKDKRVDIVLMHGAFEYQLPIKLHNTYKCEMFDFVKHFVFVGHIHTFNPNGKIIPPGSVDRLRFGEEEDKGAIYFKINPYTGGHFTFIPNKNAMRFDTITIDTDDINVAKGIILDKLQDYNSEYLRINATNPLLDKKLLAELSKEKGIMLSFKTQKDTNVNTKEEEDIVMVNQFSITPDNIKELLVKRIGESDVIIEELKELI